jgi:hypothetical protein
MKSLTAKTVGSLIESTKDPENDQIHPEKLTYQQVSEALAGAGVTPEDILWDLRDALLVDVALGFSMAVNGGGPANPENTLRYEGGHALIKFFREVVGAMGDLAYEKRRLKQSGRELDADQMAAQAPVVFEEDEDAES